jgi:hypothetical protein
MLRPSPELQPAYLRQQKLVVQSSIAADGAPQATLVGIAITDETELVFDTVSVGDVDNRRLIEGNPR